jgi:hypothetical protein
MSTPPPETHLAGITEAEVAVPGGVRPENVVGAQEVLGLHMPSL